MFTTELGAAYTPPTGKCTGEDCTSTPRDQPISIYIPDQECTQAHLECTPEHPEYMPSDTAVGQPKDQPICSTYIHIPNPECTHDAEFTAVQEDSGAVKRIQVSDIRSPILNAVGGFCGF